MNDESSEYLRELLKKAEDDWFRSDHEEDHYVHGIRKLWCLTNEHRFPEDESESNRMSNYEFLAYALGMCSVSYGPSAICGVPTVNPRDPGFTLEHLECFDHVIQTREEYGDLEDC